MRFVVLRFALFFVLCVVLCCVLPGLFCVFVCLYCFSLLGCLLACWLACLFAVLFVRACCVCLFGRFFVCLVGWLSKCRIMYPRLFVFVCLLVAWLRGRCLHRLVKACLSQSEHRQRD